MHYEYDLDHPTKEQSPKDTKLDEQIESCPQSILSLQLEIDLTNVESWGYLATATLMNSAP